MKFYETNLATRQYVNEIKRVKTLDDLRAVLEMWKPIAFDAWQVAQAMTEETFKEFKAGHELDQSGQFWGEELHEKYKAILYPEISFAVEMASVESEADYEDCFSEMVERGFITFDAEGIGHLKKIKI